MQKLLLILSYAREAKSKRIQAKEKLYGKKEIQILSDLKTAFIVIGCSGFN